MYQKRPARGRLSRLRINTPPCDYLNSVLNELRVKPEKLRIIKANCEYYKTQVYLKRGFLLAIERIEWVLALDNDIQRICNQISANDYIGNRIRLYPLLFKGVVTTHE
ncbi:hypothetical protein [Pseudoalteromonas sp. MMG005]|uniref:hypothetical protein n=1 Tax=Pseudoalteromonas sp. MMG005 TaxID=2822682 RepID=UPI001FFD2AE9|nr:hypothetical protein [Pseudoalteromonas sp. MMG005]